MTQISNLARKCVPPPSPTVTGDTVGGISLLFDADFKLGTVGDLDISSAEFGQYRDEGSTSYKDGKLCLRLTLPALISLLKISETSGVTHENLLSIRVQYNALKLAEEEIEKGRKSWNLVKRFGAKRKVPLFVTAARNVLSMTAVTSEEISRKILLISTQTETLSAVDISPTKTLKRVLVPLEDPDANETEEYLQHRGRDTPIPEVEEYHDDEFSDNASTIRQSTYQPAASSSSSTRRPLITVSAGDPQEESTLVSIFASNSTDTAGVSLPAVPANVTVNVNIIDKLYCNCIVANDSASMVTPTFTNK